MTTVTIPASPAELEEMLNDPARLAEVFGNPDTTKDFLNKYAMSQLTANNGELSTLIKESSQAALAEMLKANPKSINRLNLIPPGLEGSQYKASSAVRNAAYNASLPTAKLDGLYNNLGAIALDVHKHRSGRDVANPDAFAEVQRVTNAYSETDPATGGFLVPEETRSNLLQLALEQSIVRSRASVITMGSLTTSIPFVDATTHVGSVFGGMVFYWVGEGASITPTEAKFGRVKLEASKLVGGARVPNELWADAPALTTWLETAAPMGLAFYEDVAFINGNGVGQPLGIRQSGAKIQVTRATTDELEPADIYGMYARMLPQSLGSAVWLVNQTLLPKLFGMQTVVEATGTPVGGGFPLGVVNIANQPVPAILGRPMIVTEKVPALASGTGDDIMFVDFRYYLLGDRQAVSLDYSEHSRFMNDETELRLIERVDGRPWVQSALTPLNGETVSPVIGLAD
jgi:HK97 family phage major capsid protein